MKRRNHTKVKPVSPGRAPSKSGRVYSKYDQEYKKRPDVVEKNKQRARDRRKAEAEGRVSKGDGKDVHHVSGVGRGGRTRIEDASKNRGRK